MRNLVLSLLFFVAHFTAYCAHIIGGEVYYDYLGNDQYLLTFEIYRDCNGPGALFDNPLHFTAFKMDNTMYSDYTAYPVIDTLPIIYDDPCVTPPNDICVERGVYQATITLPPTVDGYYITYQRCCWTSAISNIDVPADWGITISTHIPGTNEVTVPNNSARFNNYPPIVLCSGQTLDFDHAATDPDGDSLVYHMCTPDAIYTFDPGAPQPIPNNPGPYASTPWATGFSDILPFGPGSSVVLDGQTGAMSITPGPTGLFVASVCVEEWRDGVLINMKSRTFGYRVVQCQVETPMQVDVIGDAILIEDCGSAGFIVTRDDSTDNVVLQIVVSGTSTNGTDYNYLADSLVIPAGQFTDTITVTPFLDGITEGNETLEFSIIIENVCEGTFDTTTAMITIVDYIEMGLSTEDSINVCDEFGEEGMLWCIVQNGVPGYSYYWDPLDYVNNDTLTFPASVLEPNLNLMTVTVTDACGKSIQSAPIMVYNQCPLLVPNVITMNDDGINDYFVIRNRLDYDQISIVITNRWGNVVYENDNYLDDWSGYSQNGQPLDEGVYYYMVTPKSEKFEYDDQEKTLYTLHGFFHIVK